MTEQDQVADIVQQATHEQALGLGHLRTLGDRLGKESAVHAAIPEGIDIHQLVGQAGECLGDAGRQRQIVDLLHPEDVGGARYGVDLRAKAVERTVRHAQHPCGECRIE